MSITGVGEIASLAESVINKLWPDKSEQERQQLAAMLTVVQGQLDTNKAEAANPSLWTSGWRPGVGWTCGAGFAVQFVVGPLGEWLATLCGHPVKFPQLDLGTMTPLLIGMLGLGGMRSVEKLNGAEGNR
jgi:hypothetical protein